ncbi:MAG: hypothetical protein IKH05_11700 [Bacteroidaceae bacterium]|nr:hypothetical protein [Bacteroidaceae bacterium]
MAKIADEQRNEIIRQFYVAIVRGLECDVDDGIYDEIDQDLLDGVDFNDVVEICNFQGVRKVISEGLKSVYGIDLGMEEP